MLRNCGMLKFRRIESVTDKSWGALTPIEFPKNIPFDINRIYYIYNVEEGVTRGFHSHRELHQVLIAVNGSVKIKVKNAFEEEVIELNNPSEGLYIGPLVWREMFDFKDDAVLLVLASDKYNEKDYIRDWDSYVNESNLLFSDGKRED